MNILIMALADAIAIAALCTLYMVRHRNRELMISYAVINAGIFTVSVALVSAGSNASAMGMGLFGVLSIIRLRSTALSQRGLLLRSSLGRHDRGCEYQPGVHRLRSHGYPGRPDRDP